MSKLFGERLKLARDLACVSKGDLVDALNVTLQTINNYERGDRMPGPEAVATLAGLLGVSVGFLTVPKAAEAEKQSALFFRSLRSSETKRRNLKFGAILQLVADDLAWLHRWLTFPSHALPTIPPGKKAWDVDEIEQIAERTREEWGLGMNPIPRLQTLLESKGIFCFALPSGDTRIDAFSGIYGGMPIIVTDIGGTDRARHRFNVAHELGHLVLHRHLTDDELAMPGTLQRVESEANRFAGAFLMPQASFSREMSYVALSTLEMAKQRWGASIAAMTFRCKDLDLINEKRARELFRQLSVKKWNRPGAEPGNEHLIEERPNIVKAGLETLTNHWSGAIDQMVEDQHTPGTILKDAFNVKHPDSKIVSFKPRMKTDLFE